MRFGKRITHKIYDIYTQRDLLEATMPWDPRRAKDGKYSRFWKGMRKVLAECEGVSPMFIHSDIIVERNTSKLQNERQRYKWPCGIEIDLPSDATDYDFDIVIAQINVLGMSFTPPQAVKPRSS